jgi:type I restriction enzyme M protein
VIFIDAVNEVTRERAQSFLTPAHQQRIATLAEIAANAATCRSRCT